MPLLDSLSVVSVSWGVGLLSSETPDLQNSDQVFPTYSGEAAESVMLEKPSEQKLIIVLRGERRWAEAVEHHL